MKSRRWSRTAARWNCCWWTGSSAPRNWPLMQPPSRRWRKSRFCFIAAGMAAELGLAPGDRVALQLPGGEVRVRLKTAPRMSPRVAVLPRHHGLPWQKLSRVAGVAYAGQHQQNIGTGYGLSLDHRLHRLAGQTRHSAGGAAPPGRLPDLTSSASSWPGCRSAWARTGPALSGCCSPSPTPSSC